MKKRGFIMLFVALISLVGAKASGEVIGGLPFTTSESERNVGVFVIEGKVGTDIADAAYNIYITNVGGNITDSDFVTRVPVKNREFRYEANLDDIKLGRLRAIMEDGELCSAWIDMYFLPGFTVDMTVHNGYFTIHNLEAYNAGVTKWLNSTLAMGGQPSVTLNGYGVGLDNKISRETEILHTTLEAYEDMLAEINDQIRLIASLGGSLEWQQKEITKLGERMEGIRGKMEAVIQRYSKLLDSGYKE